MGHIDIDHGPTTLEVLEPSWRYEVSSRNQMVLKCEMTCELTPVARTEMVFILRDLAYRVEHEELPQSGLTSGSER